MLVVFSICRFCFRKKGIILGPGLSKHTCNGVCYYCCITCDSCLLFVVPSFTLSIILNFSFSAALLKLMESFVSPQEFLIHWMWCQISRFLLLVSLGWCFAIMEIILGWGSVLFYSPSNWKINSIYYTFIFVVWLLTMLQCK